MIRASGQEQDRVSGLRQADRPLWSRPQKRSPWVREAFRVTGRVLRVPFNLIEWWWKQFVSGWIVAVIILVALVFGVGLALRHLVPRSVIVVSPFEISENVVELLGGTGQTIANMVTDDLRRIAERATRVTVGHFSSGRSPDAASHDRTLSQLLRVETGHLIESFVAESHTPVSLDVAGFSLQRPLAEWRRLREKQLQLTGDVLLDSGHVTLRARIGDRWHWKTSPRHVDSLVLMRLVEEIALAVWGDVEPQIAGGYYLSQGSPVQALAAFRTWLDRSDSRADAHVAVAHAYERLDDNQQALAHYQEAYNEEPSHGMAGRLLARALVRAGMWDSAGTILKSLKLTDDEVDAEIRYEYAMFLFDNEQVDSAAATLREAIKDNEKFAQLRSALGYVLIGRSAPNRLVLHLETPFPNTFDPSATVSRLQIGKTLAPTDSNAGAGTSNIGAAATDGYQHHARLELGATRISSLVNSDGWPLLLLPPQATPEQLRIPPLDNNVLTRPAERQHLEESIDAFREANRLATRNTASEPVLANTRYNLAVAFATQGSQDSAIHYFQDAVSLDSSFTEARTELAGALLANGRHAEALNALRDIDLQDEQDRRVTYLIGLAYAGLDSLDIALDYFRSTVGGASGISDAAALYALGVALFRTDSVEKSIEAFGRALEVDSSLTQARYQLGVSLLRKGDARAAVETLSNIAEPRSSQADYVLGIAQLQSGQTAEAISSLQEVVKTDSTFAEAHYLLGVALGKRNRNAEASQSFRKAAALDTTLAEPHFRMGLQLLEQEQYADAAWRFRLAIERRNTYPEAHYGLALSLLMSSAESDYRAATNAFRQAASVSRNSVESLAGLGASLILDDQTDAALLTLRRAVQRAPSSVPARYNLSLAYARSGDLESAELQLDAVRGLPAFPEVDYMLGFVRLWQGNPAAAIEPLERVRYVFPGARYVLANAQYQDGRLDEAIENYRAVADRYPEARIDLATALLTDNQIDSAIVQFKASIDEALHPDGAALNNLAWALYHKGSSAQLDSAAAYSDRSLGLAGLDPREEWIYRDTRANIALDQGKPELALRLFDDAIQLSGKTRDELAAMLHLGRGMSLLELGNDSAAVNAFGKANEISYRVITEAYWREAHYSPLAIGRLQRLQQLWRYW